MAADTNLPENDRDLMLAKAIGNALDTRSSFSDLTDELMQPLLQFQSDEQEETLRNPADSAKLWNAIEAQTKTEKKSRAPVTELFTTRTPYYWAAAAVVLIAAFLGLYWATLSPEPRLVAQSDSVIENITLPDGSEVILRPYSKLYETKVSSSERAYMLDGEAFFDVESDANRPFSIQAGQGMVTVLGTRFNLSNWGNTTMVYLEEGSVRFSSGDAQLVLEPGQQSALRNGTLESPANVEADQFTDWMNNMLVFNGSSPAEVVAEIGQHFNVIINIDELDDQSGLNGSLELNSLAQTLEDLGLVLGGTFRQTSDDEYTFIAMD